MVLSHLNCQRGPLAHLPTSTLVPPGPCTSPRVTFPHGRPRRGSHTAPNSHVTRVSRRFPAFAGRSDLTLRSRKSPPCYVTVRPGPSTVLTSSGDGPRGAEGLPTFCRCQGAAQRGRDRHRRASPLTTERLAAAPFHQGVELGVIGGGWPGVSASRRTQPGRALTKGRPGFQVQLPVRSTCGGWSSTREGVTRQHPKTQERGESAKPPAWCLPDT